MKTKPLTILVTCCLAMVPLDHAAGEVFLLKHGGKVEGEWLNSGQVSPEIYEIKTITGGRITLSAAMVDRVIAKSEELKEYERLLPKVPDTLAGHLEMAEYCRKSNLKAQRAFHLRKVLDFDPDHEAARGALGYSRIKGKWVKVDDWLKRQGYVRHRGAWRLPQEVELEARQQRHDIEEKEWRTRIRRWRSAIVRGRDDHGESLHQLRAINSPAALPGLTALLTDDDQPKPLKLVILEVIGRFPSTTTVNALLQCVMKETDRQVRERCLDELKRHNTNYAADKLVKMLEDKDNNVVNRAAWVLGQLGNSKAVPPLIDALTTNHKFKVQSGSGGQYNAGFTPTGGGGFSTGGGQPKIIKRDLRNEQVLAALTALVPEGTNFGYDKRSWKNWYAQQDAPIGMNLRRDE